MRGRGGKIAKNVHFLERRPAPKNKNGISNGGYAKAKLSENLNAICEILVSAGVMTYAHWEVVAE